MQWLRGGCGRRGRGLGEGQRAQAQSPELQEEPEPQQEANRAESPAEPTGEVPDAGGAGRAAPEATGGVQPDPARTGRAGPQGGGLGGGRQASGNIPEPAADEPGPLVHRVGRVSR